MTLPPLDLTAWKANMAKYAKPPTDLESSYYDAIDVFYRVADYTGDSKYLAMIPAALTQYRDLYLLANNGALPGYWLFPHGLLKHWQRTGDTKSADALLLLRRNGNFVNSSGWNDANQPDWQYLRETAYALNVHLNSIEWANLTRIRQLKDMLLDQICQSYVSFSPRILTPLYRKPFMLALTGQALINYYNTIYPDSGILYLLRIAADYCWQHLWIANPVTYPGHPSFKYTDDIIAESAGGQGQYETPDLNLLICPLWGWLYKMTGDVKYITQGDQMWASGSTFTNTLGSGKQFNQNYRWSFDYLTYRGT